MLDTNIVIDHVRQKRGETMLMRAIRHYSKKHLALSVLSIQELYAGKSVGEVTGEAFLIATISPLTTLAYTYEAARLAGEIIRNSPLALTFPDAGIAATAIENDAELLTLNTKDFKNISELRLASLPR